MKVPSGTRLLSVGVQAIINNSPYTGPTVIVLMTGPYDNFYRKVNGINAYDVFGSNRLGGMLNYYYREAA